MKYSDLNSYGNRSSVFSGRVWIMMCSIQISSKSATRLEEQIGGEISKTTTPIANPCKTGIVETFWRAKKKFEVSGMDRDSIGGIDFMKIELEDQKSTFVNSKKYFSTEMNMVIEF